MRLAEEGKLALDDPIREHLPDLDTGGYEITIADMLHQVSGLPDRDLVEVSRARGPDPTGGDASISARAAGLDVGAGLAPGPYLAAFRGQPLHYAPRERWSYSQSSYDLMCLVIADLSGTTYYRASTLAVSARRRHDVGKSGWWVLITLVPLVGIYALVMNGFVKGTQGANTFGLEPAASPALGASPAA